MRSRPPSRSQQFYDPLACNIVKSKRTSPLGDLPGGRDDGNGLFDHPLRHSRDFDLRGEALLNREPVQLCLLLRDLMGMKIALLTQVDEFYRPCKRPDPNLALKTVYGFHAVVCSSIIGSDIAARARLTHSRDRSGLGYSGCSSFQGSFTSFTVSITTLRSRPSTVSVFVT